MALPETHPADASLFSSNDPPLNLPPSDNNIDDSDSFDDEDPENETHYTVDNEGKTGLEEQQQQKKEIAKDETRMVGRMRLILLLVLVACVIVVSLAVNFYVKNEENSDFETEFFSDANKVIEGISGSLDITLGAVDAYASKMVGLTKVDNGGDVSETTIVDNVNANTTSTSSAIPTSFPSRFPFVTVPGFGVQAAKMIKLSRAAQFIVALIVTAQDREAWDAYSVQNTQWINETIAVLVQENNPDFHGTSLSQYMNPVPTILHYDENGIIPAQDPFPVMDPPNYMVSWQRCPLMEGYNYVPYNWDLWIAGFVDEFNATASSQRVVISRSTNVLYNASDETQLERYNQEGEGGQVNLGPDATWCTTLKASVKIFRVF